MTLVRQPEAAQAHEKPVKEDPNRLDEQHETTTKVLGFLIHPSIPLTSANLKIADIGAGSGSWLQDLATKLPSTTQLIGYDITSAAFPPHSRRPPNVSFREQDMNEPFPTSELGTYDIVAARFLSSATPRKEWMRTVTNLMTLLKPGGWIQWIDSCNFAVYNAEAGTSRAACQSIYDGLDSFRKGDDLVIGLMMREKGDSRRGATLQDLGLTEVHEDVFSTDKIQDPALDLRRKATLNIIDCFVNCLGSLVGAEGSLWTKERIEELHRRALNEVDDGVYHTLDQVCIIGRKPL